jgi:Ca2+/Na+ antiporter
MMRYLGARGPIYLSQVQELSLSQWGCAGGGLFVGCVVAGAIMLANGGAKARGALMRDVSAYCISVVTVTVFMWTGEMTYLRSALLLILYVAFVVLVLGADLWHIFTR